MAWFKIDFVTWLKTANSEEMKGLVSADGFSSITHPISIDKWLSICCLICQQVDFEFIPMKLHTLFG